jgi:hypothetical protein
VSMNLIELQRGEPIPDSIYVRDFCADCGEAIRVPDARIGKANRCDKCRRVWAPAAATVRIPS